jgi:hypothetical protein
VPSNLPPRDIAAEYSEPVRIADLSVARKLPPQRHYPIGYLRKGVAPVLKIFTGFLGGIIYGAIYVIEVPDGMISKAAAILKMIFFS